MTTTQVKYIAINEYGNKQFLMTEHPRKELMEKLYATHADKMYCDPDAAHVGYVIQGQWWTLYAVEGRGPRTKGAINA